VAPGNPIALGSGVLQLRMRGPPAQTAKIVSVGEAIRSAASEVNDTRGLYRAESASLKVVVRRAGTPRSTPWNVVINRIPALGEASNQGCDDSICGQAWRYE
jgi:hypothetical protein